MPHIAGSSPAPIVDTLWDVRGYVAFLERPELSSIADYNADPELNPDNVQKYIKVRGYYETFWSGLARSVLPDGPSDTGDPDIYRNTEYWKPQPTLPSSAKEAQKEELFGSSSEWPVTLLVRRDHGSQPRSVRVPEKLVTLLIIAASVGSAVQRG
ncbi:hypothetical protein M409DRAFT_18688 [Zasmidium cellare ATCC 36951]|uniref:Uncharacterized protein n=1 Tax=Zasmidium cellare ATCC 36951 TaxID=1080233 RepID=A0A6A6CX18_ZASCE|nr:uncharacterized protein M409DRAFT_18688 [Zasmidium cellare ATCC 36951]KAF2171575.1 hypothetical protein M409DRAFT_18688 [Zasmidium cellare ATCC 36951]